MQSADTFSIAFFSSSDFTLPILQNILDVQGSTLESVLQSQLTWVLENKSDFIDVIPEFWFEKSWFEDILRLPEIKTLLHKKIKLKTVVSQPSRENRGKILQNPVVNFANQNTLPLFTPEKINRSTDEFTQLFLSTKSLDITDDILDFDLAVVASFGQIISQKVLDIPKYGFINWHPSKLPMYRGATPMQSALHDGQKEVALSWIEMTKDMDAGDILLQLGTDILESDTIQNLSKKMGEIGSHTWAIASFVQCVNILDKIPQNSDKATFTKVLSKEDRFVDPNLISAAEIYNHWRAYLFFPGTAFLEKSYFDCEVKLIEIKNSKKVEGLIVFENEIWKQVRVGRQVKTFLKCKLGSEIEVFKIGLAGGKKIDFSGYLFT